MRRKIYLLPALCSFFVIGLGQVVKGDSKRALRWILFFYIFYPGLTYVALLIHGNAFAVMLAMAVIVYPLFWIYNVIDALFKKVKQ